MRGNRADLQLHGVTKEIKRSQEAGLICYLGENGMLFSVNMVEGLERENFCTILLKEKLFWVLQAVVFDVASLVEHIFWV